jgi:hypothetical protein
MQGSQHRILEFKVVSNPDFLGFTRRTATSSSYSARDTAGAVQLVGLTPRIGVIASTASTCLSSTVMKYFVFGTKGILWWSS